MTLREYIEQLNNLCNGNKEALDYLVVTASDDEGNDYQPVYYSPSLGCYNNDRQWTPLSHFEEDQETNAVCVN